MLKKGLLLIAATAVSVSAFAGGLDQAPAAAPQKDVAHAYAGAQLGYVAHYGFDKAAKLTNGVYNNYAAYTKEQGDFGARVFAGYMFDKYMGVELGAGTFGSQKFAIDGSVSNGVSAKGTQNDIRSTAVVGFDASVVGNMPVTEQMFVFAKAGMALVDWKTKAINGYALDAQSSNGTSVSHWNWMPRAELGLGYDITSDMAVTVSYAHYFGINGSKSIKDGADTGKISYKTFGPSFGMAAVGLTYSF
jgi:OOP family OmpA-OmpF porin